jgi:hypothetical protein
MNVCASYIHAINSPDQKGRTYSYTKPFGPFLNPKGTTEFPRFDFKTPSILKQLDGWNCGLACVANAVAFVRHFEKTDFVLSAMQLVTDDPNEIRYIVDPTRYNLRSFWERVGKKALAKYKESSTTALLPRLRQEFVLLIEDLATLRSGTTKENEVIEILETDKDNVVDLTIEFPKNITPLKSKEKDDANVISERKKKKVLKKKEIMDALQPHLVNDQKSDDEAKAFANVFLSKCWRLYDL